MHHSADDAANIEQRHAANKNTAMSKDVSQPTTCHQKSTKLNSQSVILRFRSSGYRGPYCQRVCRENPLQGRFIVAELFLDCRQCNVCHAQVGNVREENKTSAIISCRTTCFTNKELLHDDERGHRGGRPLLLYSHTCQQSHNSWTHKAENEVEAPKKRKVYRNKVMVNLRKPVLSCPKRLKIPPHSARVCADQVVARVLWGTLKSLSPAPPAPTCSSCWR